MPPTLFRVILPVDDLARAVAFYSAALGIRGHQVAPNRHYFPCGSTILACVDPAGHGGKLRPNPDYVYIAVDDLEATLVAARAAGATDFDARDQEPGIALRPWGERSFYVRDPFGNPLCFVQAGTEFTGT
jgi:catechol 2,3-dioxygenase-like lactoylglutathione lyase family enzyme